ncbi:type II toxin-antitoxin system HicB family antitoxin [Methanolobus psychrotolerans]|uniref:type II toxin-antitoxin system HicB family antitoxin n=1 Tax=Methanolobus psychrotolerans TaxID=1874706 RepID=UPI000B9186DE|nr:type II toxin-antitoxin system HicB family antitoxin [Methanolobus psychrotolerans]
MQQSYKFSAVIHKEGDWYVSWCPELDIASHGKNVEEAVANLKEAVELYLEDEDATTAEVNSILTTTFEVSCDNNSHSVSA